MEDGTQKHHRKTQNILKLSDEDEDNNLVPRPKKSKGRKQSKKRSTVIDSSSNEQVSKKWKPNKTVTSKNAMVIDSEVFIMPLWFLPESGGIQQN